MDIETLKLTRRSLALIIYVCCSVMLLSCSSEKGTEEHPQVQPDLTAIKERMKATELAYEYEQFVTKIWQELNFLSDSLADLQANPEVKAPQRRKEKMASIVRRLKELEDRLRKAESNNALTENDKQRINELRDAIKHKDATIRKLKNENTDLRDKNADLRDKNANLGWQLEQKKQALDNKERELFAQKRASAIQLERQGDYLRRLVVSMGGKKGTGNYEAYKEGQIKMVETSLYCYEQANTISPTQNLRNKIVRTQNGLELYRKKKSDDLSGLDF